ncbi:MAG: 30S ribosomal protein S18 [Dehalococcoidia bacterium]|nr:30S ribosomal protein S18 [Dehalococcoidia bacterium]MSQ17451.1 30S ribosomal protein S18 [Dehalococcoidia bacterium]
MPGNVPSPELAAAQPGAPAGSPETQPGQARPPFPPRPAGTFVPGGPPRFAPRPGGPGGTGFRPAGPGGPPRFGSSRPGGPGGYRPGGSGGPRTGGPGGGDRRGRPEGGRGRFPPRRRYCIFCAEHVLLIDYKDVERLRRFVSDRAKMEPPRKTGVCAKHQRELSTAIKRARHLALLPFVPFRAAPRGMVHRP